MPNSKYKMPTKPGQLYFYCKLANGIPVYGKDMRGNIREKYFFILMTYMYNFGHLNRKRVLSWCHVVKNNVDPENIMQLIDKKLGGN